MLYDLVMQPEKSEYWYKELADYEKDKVHSREHRREARVRLAYLDIALPHRGTEGILRIMKHVFDRIGKGDIILPEMSVTGNMPSLVNGGLDFSDWSRADAQIAKFMGRPLEVIVGRYGKGLVTTALAESGFEKGTMQPYEVMTRTTSGYEAASHGGKIEICFVACAIQVRQHVIEGQYPSAKRVMNSFHDNVITQNAVNLLPNLEAFEAWLSLYTGSQDSSREYIETVSVNQMEFTILDRYRWITKVRCLIAENRLMEALELANFLTLYFESYSRDFYRMENEVLKGIILYRLEDAHWKEHIYSSLKEASGYHFVRLVSLEGAAVLPLLVEMKSEGALSGIDEAYFSQVIAETEKMARIYPDYLKCIPKEEIKLTKRESQILALLCGGSSMEEICDILKITANGLKKHNYNLYKKLGVSSRAEAERKASKLGLVIRE